MSYKCVIVGCQSTAKRRKKDKISFFRFPLTIPKLLEQWIAAINRQNWIPTISSRVCQRHFKDDDFSSTGVKITRLKPDVVPSQNLSNHNPDRNMKPNTDSDELIFSAESVNSTQTFSYLQKHNVSEILKKTQIKCYKLEDRNKKHYNKINNLTQKYKKQSYKQGNMFKDMKNQEMMNLMRKKMRVINKYNQRKTKIDSLINDSKNSKVISNKTDKSNIGNVSYKILQNDYQNKNEQQERRYSENVKRSVFKLPHSSSSQNWLSNGNIEPGFQLKILEALSKLGEEDKDCNLLCDSMVIRQQIIWNPQEQKYIGFCDYGNSVSFEDIDMEAKEALVFLLVSIKGAWKWPIAFFLVNKISSTILCELIRLALIHCHQYNLRIHGLTFDVASNYSAVNILGADIFPKNFKQIKNIVPYPFDESRHVKIILDPCHMIKLARNALADYKEFKSDEGSIKWDYIVKLYALRNQLNFELKNGLAAQCVNWEQNKIKVKYAVQVLSSSIANAIEFLEAEGFEDFQGSSATVKYLRIIDRLFDILNSRNPFGKDFKAPIFPKNIEYLKQIVHDTKEYLFSLKTIDGRLLYRTARKTFIYGLLITAQSILDISSEIFKNNQSFKYILSHKFSQDHIEILFSKIRGHHGFKNNPTCQQFKYAMRHILLHTDIKTSNCFELDTEYATSIYPIMWKKERQNNIFNDLNIESDDEYDNEFYEMPWKRHETVTDYIIYYISGYIIKQLNYINCESCVLNLRNINFDNKHNYVNEETFSAFFNFCNNRFLKPSASVFYICKETEKQLQIITNYFSQLNIKQIDKKIINKVKNILIFNKKIFPTLQCDVNLLEMPHKVRLIITICNEYITVRLHSFAKFYHNEILKSIRQTSLIK